MTPQQILRIPPRVLTQAQREFYFNEGYICLQRAIGDDWIGILLLTAPIFVPVVIKLGFDPVWMGVLFCMNMQISYISPPFGPAAFYLKGVTPPDISLGDIFRSIWPYMGLQIIALGLVIAFPQIALWLPGTMAN